MKKTIFHLIRDLDVGGTEKMLLEILPRLDKNFKNYTVCFTGSGDIGKKLEAKKIPVFCLNYEGFWNIIPVFIKFRKLTKKYQPDILNTYLPLTDIFGRICGKILGIPKIVCNIRSTHKEKQYKKVILLDYLTSFLVDKYTINSPAILSYYSSLYPFNKSKFVYIPNGINISEYTADYDIIKLKNNLFLPTNNIVITCVSNLHKGKGHKYLLKAFEDIYKDNREISLLIVGNGKEKKALAEEIKSYGSKKNILFLGYRTDIKELLAITDIFVLPTLFEGMSNALLEAMASGCAIITTDIPENKALIEQKHSGVLVPVKNSQKIAGAINYLIKNPEQRWAFGKTARESVKKGFEIKKIIKDLEKLYQTI